MIYTYSASGNYSGNYASLGIKKFMVRSRLGNVLKAGTPIVIKSDDQSIIMSGIIIYYDNESTGKDAFVSVDIEKSNGDLSYYSQNWTLVVNDSLADPEVAAIIESSYGKPIESAYVDGITGRPRTPQLDSDDQPVKYVPRYIEDPFETPIQTPVENPYIKPDDVPPENPYIKPEETQYVPTKPLVSEYTPPVPVYTPLTEVYTPPTEGYTQGGGASFSEPFYVIYKISLLVLIIALIIGIVLYFVFKNKNSQASVNNIIAAFGKIW